MEEKCLWCKYYRTEYQPEIRKAPRENHQFGDELVWKIGTTLFLGCAKGPVEFRCSHNDWCEKFKWNYLED